MSLPARMLCCLVCLLSLQLRADFGMYDSVEWKTAMADGIGVYQVTKVQEAIFGPPLGPPVVGMIFPKAYFRLKRVLRGHPAETFSRISDLTVSEFKAGEMDIFFFVSEERLQRVSHPFSQSRSAFFHGDDYVWLERPVGEQRGVAIDHDGKILAGSNEVMRTVLMSLALPRAHPEIDWRSYFLPPLSEPDNGVDGKALKSHGTRAAYPRRKEFNYRLTVFPTKHTPSWKEPWVNQCRDVNLVVPSVLFIDRDASGREISVRQAEELARAYLTKHFPGGTEFHLESSHFYSDSTQREPKSWGMYFSGGPGLGDGLYSVFVYMDGFVELDFYGKFSLSNLTD